MIYHKTFDAKTSTIHILKEHEEIVLFRRNGMLVYTKVAS